MKKTSKPKGRTGGAWSDDLQKYHSEYAVRACLRTHGNDGLHRKKMKRELEAITESGKAVTVVATGGLSTLIDDGVDCIDHVDKMLTLEGLEIIYQK